MCLNHLILIELMSLTRITELIMLRSNNDPQFLRHIVFSDGTSFCLYENINIGQIRNRIR